MEDFNNLDLESGRGLEMLTMAMETFPFEGSLSEEEDEDGTKGTQDYEDSQESGVVTYHIPQPTEYLGEGRGTPMFWHGEDKTCFARLVLCPPREILGTPTINADEHQGCTEIHPQIFPDWNITEEHLNMVFEVSDQHSQAREGAIEFFTKLQKETRENIGFVLKSWLTQAARHVGLIDDRPARKVNHVTENVVQNPTRENLKKLWFVMYGVFDNNKPLFLELEREVMRQSKLVYKRGCVKLEVRRTKKGGKPVQETRKEPQDRSDSRRDLYGVGCVGQQIKAVLQFQQKNINRKLMTEIGVSICMSKPLVIKEKRGVMKAVQQRRRVKSVFEPCFVRVKNGALWQKVCATKGIPKQETQGYTWIEKGSGKKKEKVGYIQQMGPGTDEPSWGNHVTPWKCQPEPQALPGTVQMDQAWEQENGEVDPPRNEVSPELPKVKQLGGPEKDASQYSYLSQNCFCFLHA